MMLLLLSISGGMGGFSYFSVGYDAQTLNQAFAGKIEGFPSSGWGSGGGGFAIINNFLIGGFGFGSSMHAEGDSLFAEVSCGGGFFEVGYIYPFWKLFGMVELGIGGIGTDIFMHEPLGDASFDEVLDDPGRTTRISAGGIGFMGGAGLIVKLSPFCFLSLRGMYIYSPSQPDWRFEDGSNCTGGPDMNPSSWVLSVGIMFGGVGEE